MVMTLSITNRSTLYALSCYPSIVQSEQFRTQDPSEHHWYHVHSCGSASAISRLWSRWVLVACALAQSLGPKIRGYGHGYVEAAIQLLASETSDQPYQCDGFGYSPSPLLFERTRSHCSLCIKTATLWNYDSSVSNLCLDRVWTFMWHKSNHLIAYHRIRTVHTNTCIWRLLPPPPPTTTPPPTPRTRKHMHAPTLMVSSPCRPACPLSMHYITVHTISCIIPWWMIHTPVCTIKPCVYMFDWGVSQKLVCDTRFFQGR